jgi:zinc transport system ATP-binding protein
MALIECRDLSLAYEGLTVVRSVRFSLGTGDYLWILGENGSGKSTLLRGILGLKSPETGGVFWGEGLSPREVGYLPQQGVGQDFPAGVYEVVLSGRLGKRGFRPFYSREDKLAAEENLRRLGIGDLRNRFYRELSGGQRQRALLARSLCAGSRLLLLDEPAAALDPLASAEFYRLLAELNRQGITIIMVSHDTGSALQYASHILHLNHEPLFFGSPGDYRESEIGKYYAGGFRHD